MISGPGESSAVWFANLGANGKVASVSDAGVSAADSGGDSAGGSGDACAGTAAAAAAVVGGGGVASVVKDSNETLLAETQESVSADLQSDLQADADKEAQWAEQQTASEGAEADVIIEREKGGVTITEGGIAGECTSTEGDGAGTQESVIIEEGDGSGE
ncbi:unnamed protein product, partial [Closterium sp. NIES-54]